MSKRGWGAGAVCLVAAAGVSAMILTHAATNTLSIEAEAGTLSGNASTVNDASASGGKGVRFGLSGGGAMPSIRGITENVDGTHNTLFKQLGFTTVNASPTVASLDKTKADGLNATVWMGDYNNTTCTFDVPDATVTSDVKAIMNHPALLGYFIADEPEQAETRCPNVASQLQARTDMIHAIDSRHFTYAIVSNQGTSLKCYNYAKFMGTIDVMGLDIYPLRQDASYVPCVSNASKPFTDISQAIAAWNTQSQAYKASHPSFVPRFYAVVQDFQDTIWRRPTVSELQQQYADWQGSGMEGIWYFSWDWQGNSLDGNTTHQCEYKRENQVSPAC